MANPAGESNAEVLRLDFDRRLMLQFRGSVVTKYAIRLPVNRILQERIGHLLTRPIGRPPNEVRRSYANFYCLSFLHRRHIFLSLPSDAKQFVKVLFHLYSSFQ